MGKKNYKDIDWIIAQKIYELRTSRRMTQETLGKELGVSWQQVHKYETGKSPLKANRLYQIAIVFEEPIESFFGESRSTASMASITSLHSWSAGHRKSGS